MDTYANWYWAQIVLNRLFHFVWLHPGWTVFIILVVFKYQPFSVTFRKR